jgi:probable F420-dependent oxidoreductase
MKFIIKIPLHQIHPRGEFQSRAALREMAEALERSRATACCLTDHPAPSAEWLRDDTGAHDAVDPFAGLAFVATVTKRIKLATTVVILPYRNPFLTAKAAATLQILSDNRFILGVGVGYLKAEFDALGVPFNQRGALTDEALETIRAAWAGGAVVKQGRGFNAVGNEPRPVPAPAPPIWIGGGSDKAIERAVKWADGWAPFFAIGTADSSEEAGAITTIPQMARKIAQLKELRAKLGRTGPFEISTTSPYFPDANTPAAAEKLRGIVHELEAAGATWFTMILGCPSRAGYLENLAWFDQEVMAHFTP